MVRISKIYKKIASLYPSGFWPGFVVGLIYFSYILWWFWSLYPLDSLGVENGFYSFLLILFVFTISIAGTAFFWGLFSFFTFRIAKKNFLPWAPLITAGTFVLAEYLRSWGFGFLWLGSGSLLGPHWTLGNPAYLLASWPFILRISSVWGIYGIDFLLIWLTSIIFILIAGEYTIKSRELLLNSGLIFLVFFITIVLGGKNYVSGPNTLRVVLIQTKNPTKRIYSPEELLSNFSQENTMLKNAAKYSDIIVFPETANFSQTLSEFFNPVMVRKYFNNLAPKNILVVDSDRILESSGLKSKIIFIDSKNGITGSYDKKLLTPGGEFLPYIFKVPLSIFGHFQKNNIETPEFTPGSGNNIVAYQNNNIKVLACSDIISPPIAREGIFDFMLDLNSLGMFNGNNRIANETIAMARFRAAENGKYLIIASNYGRSYVINPYGQIERTTLETGYQILTADIVPNKERTWYNKLGDVPILLSSLAVFCLGFKNFKNAKQD